MYKFFIVDFYYLIKDAMAYFYRYSFWLAFLPTLKLTFIHAMVYFSLLLNRHGSIFFGL